MTLARNAALAAGALAVLAAPAVGQAKDAAPVKVSGAEAFKGASQVAIAAFNVGFIFESVDQTAASGGLMGAFGGTTKAQSTLTGVTPEMMQKIADAAYADFVAQLKARGYTLVQPEQLFADAAIAKVKGEAKPVDINIALEKGSKGKATYYKPSALPRLVLLPGDFQGSGLSSMGLNMNAGQAYGAFYSYAKTTKTPVVDVTYLIDFSQQKRPGAFSFGGLEVNSGLSVSAGFSKLSVIGVSGKQGSLVVNQPVAVEGEFIEKTDASSGFDKTSQAAANVAGGVAAAFGFGGLRFGKTRKFEFKAKPGNYEEGATKAASLASERLTGQLVLLK